MLYTGQCSDLKEVNTRKDLLQTRMAKEATSKTEKGYLGKTTRPGTPANNSSGMEVLSTSPQDEAMYTSILILSR